VITEETVRQIINKYLQGEATDQERALLENWYHQQGQQHPLQEEDLHFLLNNEALFEDVRRRAGLTPKRGQGLRIWRWRAYAAALLLTALSITWIFYTHQTDREPEIATSKPSDVVPGGNRAILTLAGGRRINLSETQSGIVVDQDQILYEEGAELVGLEVEEAVPLELSVPGGGTYQVTLADGTKVWLNAHSKLKYPSRFGSDERTVELEGEGYFSVSKRESGDWPFRIKVTGQTVEVLGTEFNLSAYPGEPKKTTLVEGSVRVAPALPPTAGETGHRSPVTIKPGEQAIVGEATVDVVSVDVRKYTAWKDGLFYFEHTPFDELIREIARWYDVDVVYDGAVPRETISGKMRRGLSLMTVLGLLGTPTKAKIQLDGRTLIIR